MKNKILNKVLGFTIIMSFISIIIGAYGAIHKIISNDPFIMLLVYGCVTLVIAFIIMLIIISIDTNSEKTE